MVASAFSEAELTRISAAAVAVTTTLRRVATLRYLTVLIVLNLSLLVSD